MKGNLAPYRKSETHSQPSRVPSADPCGDVSHVLCAERVRENYEEACTCPRDIIRHDKSNATWIAVMSRNIPLVVWQAVRRINGHRI